MCKDLPALRRVSNGNLSLPPVLDMLSPCRRFRSGSRIQPGWPTVGESSCTISGQNSFKESLALSTTMAQIEPFRALRYDPARVSIPQVVTQPYDKITPEMQDGYYAASPHNLVRVILGKEHASDHTGDNRYTRAAQSFRDWRQQRIFLQDAQPSLYLYVQRFTAPGGAGELERRGLIALGR